MIRKMAQFCSRKAKMMIFQSGFKFLIEFGKASCPFRNRFCSCIPRFVLRPFLKSNDFFQCFEVRILKGTPHENEIEKENILPPKPGSSTVKSFTTKWDYSHHLIPPLSSSSTYRLGRSEQGGERVYRVRPSWRRFRGEIACADLYLRQAR